VDPSHANERRRRELGEFLRSRRLRLTPDQVGLPARRRTRTPGLRREDVAELAGVSTAWYTYLEQARDIRPSRSVITSLAGALQLSRVDRDYLYALTGHAAHNHMGDRHALPSELLHQLLDTMTAPAYCTNARTDVLAWNPLAAEIFGDYGRWPSSRRNLLRLLFTESGFGQWIVDRDEYARRVVYTFRDRSRAYHEDASTVAMVDELLHQSDSFRHLWRTRQLRRINTDALQVEHPTGRLSLRLVMLQDPTATGLRVNAYLPADEPTTDIVTGLASGLPRAG
jgi:transcriptional regulator with XRE-family HTH domain